MQKKKEMWGKDVSKALEENATRTKSIVNKTEDPRTAELNKAAIGTTKDMMVKDGGQNLGTIKNMMEKKNDLPRATKKDIKIANKRGIHTSESQKRTSDKKAKVVRMLMYYKKINPNATPNDIKGMKKKIVAKFNDSHKKALQQTAKTSNKVATDKKLSPAETKRLKFTIAKRHKARKAEEKAKAKEKAKLSK